MVNTEQVIKDMEDYLLSCKPVKFSTNKYVVEMDVMEDYINSLKQNLPADIKNYKKLMVNKDQILMSAQNEAKAIVDRAVAERENLINNNDIVKQAYRINEDIVASAKEKADAMINSAMEYSEQVREGALEYADSVLQNALQNANAFYGAIKGSATEALGNLQEEIDTLEKNRNELGAMRKVPVNMPPIDSMQGSVG